MPLFLKSIWKRNGAKSSIKKERRWIRIVKLVEVKRMKLQNAERGSKEQRAESDEQRAKMKVSD